MFCSVFLLGFWVIRPKQWSQLTGWFCLGPFRLPKCRSSWPDKAYTASWGPRSGSPWGSRLSGCQVASLFSGYPPTTPLGCRRCRSILRFLLAVGGPDFGASFCLRDNFSLHWKNQLLRNHLISASPAISLGSSLCPHSASHQLNSGASGSQKYQFVPVTFPVSFYSYRWCPSFLH